MELQFGSGSIYGGKGRPAGGLLATGHRRVSGVLVISSLRLGRAVPCAEPEWRREVVGLVVEVAFVLFCSCVGVGWKLALTITPPLR